MPPSGTGPICRRRCRLIPGAGLTLYRAPGTAGDFDIISYGKDGQPGGTGDAADVTNQ